jgi:ER membrane protein complex subunit 7
LNECDDASQLRVDVPPEPESSPEVRPYAIGTPLNPPSPIKLPYPVKLVPRQRNSYFVPHQSFSVMLILQNPMMLIMVFGGVMMLAMPYIMVRKHRRYIIFSPSSLPF